MDLSKQEVRRPGVPGSQDNLEKVNQLAHDSVKQLPSTETENSSGSIKESPLTTSLPARPEESLPQEECRPMPAEQVFSYLMLAIEEKSKRQEDQAKLARAKLAEEIALIDKPSLRSPPLMNSSDIASLIDRLDVTVEDWQKVTQTANIADLLRAEQAIQASRLGFSENASEQQIRMAQQLSDMKVVTTVSDKLESIRSNPTSHTALLNEDGSVELGSFTLTLDSWKQLQRQLFATTSAMLLSAAFVLVSTAAGTLATGALLGGVAGHFFPDLRAPSVPGAFLGGAYTFVASWVYNLDYFWPKWLKLGSAIYDAQISHRLKDQKALRDLERRGIKWRSSVAETDPHSPRLTLHFYAPAKPEESSTQWARLLWKRSQRALSWYFLDE